MKTATASLSMVVAGLVIQPAAWGASVVVDWLRLGTAGSATAFALVNDAGSQVASGALMIDSGKGLSFPGLPSNNLLNGNFWVADPGFVDSGAGDARVGGLDFRVVPQNGSAGYVIELAVPAGRELVIAVGGLFRNAAGATQSLQVTAFSDSGTGAVTFLQSVGWVDPSTVAYNQDLDWDPVSGTLLTTTGSNGDSEIAFLSIGPLAGANAKIRLAVPNGYALGTGDSITIGIGQVIPEPGSFALLGLGGVFLLVARRR